MNRVHEVVGRFVEEMFGGEYAGRVERHLSAEDIRKILEAVYEIGFKDGRRVKPDACEKCGTKTTDLTLIRFVPGIIIPPGEKPQMKKLTWMCAACRQKAMNNV